MNLVKLSVSKTKTFSSCKKQYNFIYNLKLAKKDQPHHVFGKLVHKILENFHNEYIAGCTDLHNIVMGRSYKSAIHDEEFKGKLTQEMIEESKLLCIEYLKLIAKNKFNVIACEKNFSCKLSDNVTINGVIDRVQIDDDNVLHVCDYKTSKSKKYLAEDFLQLQTYAYALHQEDSSITKVRASYVMLRFNFDYITTEFDLDQILSVKDIYLKKAEDIINEKSYLPNVSPLCSYCDYLDLCEEGKEFTDKKTQQNNKYGEVNW